MMDITRELTYQNDIIKKMVANGWVQGKESGYWLPTYPSNKK